MMPKNSKHGKGNQKPTFSFVTPYDYSQGQYAIDLSKAYDLALHPWQEQILCDWLAVDQDGVLINSDCTLLVPRQNGKTGVSDPRETWGLVYRKEQILHTAQEYQTAKKAFDRLRKKFGDRKGDPMAKYPELNALVDHYTTSANQMVLDLKDGGHIEFRTRGNSSDMGRGGTFDLVVVDEAQSYTEEQDAALSPLNSAAPSGSPQTILMGTPPTPAALHKGVVFSQKIYSMHNAPTNGSCIHEWSVDNLVDVKDKKFWYMCNPSLGYQLLESALEKDMRGMSPDVFAREHLGYMPKIQGKQIDYAIDKKKWAQCVSEEKKPEGKTAFGVKISADGSQVALAGAVIGSNGITRISLIDIRNTAQGLRPISDWLNERYETASCVVIDGRNGADLICERLAGIWKLKGSVIRATTNNVIASASLLIDSINEQKITWYKYQEALDDSARTSTKRKIAGGFGFGGENPLPIEACALALWGVQNSKRNPNKKMRIG
jgi:hypothetical protein